MAFIKSEPFLKKSSKIYDLFTFVTEENIDKINFNFIVSTILSCSFNDLFFEIRLALDFISEYNNRFTKAQLDLILTRLISKLQEIENVNFNSVINSLYMIYSSCYLPSEDYEEEDNFTASFEFEKIFYFYNNIMNKVNDISIKIKSKF